MEISLVDLQASFYLMSGGVLMIAVIALLYLYPALGIGVFLGLTAISTNMRAPITVELNVAGFEIGALDVIAVSMLAVWIMKVVLLTDRPSISWIPVTLLAIVLLNIVRGILVGQLQEAVTEARGWIYLLATILYCSVAPLKIRRRWKWILFGYCGWLVGVATFGFMTSGISSATTGVLVNGELMDSRPVTSFGALALGEVLIIVVGLLLSGHSRRLLAYCLVLTIYLVLLQQRTVWIAVGLGIVYLIVSSLHAGGRARLAALVASGGIGLVSAVAFSTGLLRGSPLADSAAVLTRGGGTLSWRVEGWRDLLGASEGLIEWALGRPFGSGYFRIIAGTRLTVSPHSHYVEAVLRLGILGSILMLGFVIVLWKSSDSAAETIGVDAAVIRALIVALLISGVTYRWDPAQGVLLGTISGCIIGNSARPRTTAVTPAQQQLVGSGV